MLTSVDVVAGSRKARYDSREVERAGNVESPKRSRDLARLLHLVAVQPNSEIAILATFSEMDSNRLVAG